MTSHTPPKRCKRIITRKAPRDYTYLGCPLTKNRSPWCFRTCRPNADGTGFCGRVAPHGFKSRIQQGIEDFKKNQTGSPTLLRHQKPTGSEED